VTQGAVSRQIKILEESLGVGLAVVDRNMIVEEPAGGRLARISEIVVSGPFGYWLDIAQRHAALEHVQAFAGWLREEGMQMG